MADGGFCACGVYKLAPAALKPIRTLMVDQPDAFDAVLSALADATITLTEEATLAAMPRGFPTTPTIATPPLSGGRR